MRTARELIHGALGDSCGERYERFGHTKECDAWTAAIEARDAEHEAEKEKLREFIAGCVKLGGAQGAALEVARKALEGIAKFYVLNGEARVALAEITRLLGEPRETKPEGGRG